MTSQQTTMTKQRKIRMDEVAKHHASQKELPLWTSLAGVVYDVDAFAGDHPGGRRLIESVAGKEGTEVFTSMHPRDLAARTLGADRVVGELEASSVLPEHVAKMTPNKPVSAPPTAGAKPSIRSVLNAFDFEAVAKQSLTPDAWAYYSSGGDDEITLRENRVAFQRVWFKPRILVNVRHLDTSWDIFPQLSHYKTSLPLYFSATAMGKLADPQGETAIVRAAAASNIVYMLPTLSSCTLDEMLDARSPNQVVYSQLYVNPDRAKTAAYVRDCLKRGVRALFVTVDAPALGRREKDMRMKFVAEPTDVQAKDEDEKSRINKNEGVGRAISSFIDPGLSWEDVPWLKTIAHPMPIVLKGVQCAEDAVLALRHGCAGIVLSNHGGRQLDTARSGLEILQEVMPALRKEPGYDKRTFHVYVDGGVRRGSDIFKAIAMGARAVGIGRPVLYALGSYGQAGIERLVHVLKDELEMVMRLAGCPTINDITEAHVITKDLSTHVASMPRDALAEATYEPLRTSSDLSGFGKSSL